jgi:hypothetical protein
MGNKSLQLLIFTLENREGISFSYENVMAISTILSNHRVLWVLVGDGGVINILSQEVMAQI